MTASERNKNLKIFAATGLFLFVILILDQVIKQTLKLQEEANR